MQTQFIQVKNVVQAYIKKAIEVYADADYLLLFKILDDSKKSDSISFASSSSIEDELENIARILTNPDQTTMETKMKCDRHLRTIAWNYRAHQNDMSM